MTQALIVDTSREATFSADRRHRYTLTRWLCGEPHPAAPRTLLSIGLNPSTADESIDDPTIRKEMKLARRLGFERLVKVNIFSWRATDPLDMFAAHDAGEDVAGGLENAEAIVDMARVSDVVLAAWGGPYSPKRLAMLVEARARTVVASLVGGERIAVYALGLTKGGYPRHGLYMPDAADPVVWRAPETGGGGAGAR